MLSDIIIIAIIILFIIIGAKRGIARSILGIIGLFVTYAVAGGLSNLLSQSIYDSFLKQTVTENVNSCISAYGLDYLLDNSFSALPDSISWLVSLFGGSSETVTRYISQTTDFAASNAAAIISETLETMAVSAIKVVLMTVLFIVIYIIVKKLIRLVSRIFDAPILKQVNRFFGGVLGAANGILCVLIIVNVICVISRVTANDITSYDMIDGYLFRLFSLT